MKSTLMLCRSDRIPSTKTMLRAINYLKKNGEINFDKIDIAVGTGHVKFKYHGYLLLQLPQIFKMATHARRCVEDIKIIIRARA